MIRALALVFAVVLLVGLGAPPRVSFIRPAGFVNEYAALRYRIQIDPREEDRALVVAAFDGRVERQTFEDAVALTRKQLEGADAPRTWWITWDAGLPAGEYVVIALVLGSGHKEIARASVPVTVLARW